MPRRARLRSDRGVVDEERSEFMFPQTVSITVSSYHHSCSNSSTGCEVEPALTLTSVLSFQSLEHAFPSQHLLFFLQAIPLADNNILVAPHQHVGSRLCFHRRCICKFVSVPPYYHLFISKFFPFQHTKDINLVLQD